MQQERNRPVQHVRRNHLLHLFAGGIGSTVAQCVTCPLDVVQTRLQSTKLNFNYTAINALYATTVPSLQFQKPIIGFGYFQILVSYMRYMVHSEGVQSLFKGLTPSLVGIVPAKSLYFFCYASAKSTLSNKPLFKDHQHTIHSLSAVSAGVFTGTVTNPVWYIKTKLQLHSTEKPKNIREIVRLGYKKHGFKCFFRGISASYVGVLETVIYFLLYEEFKQTIRMNQSKGEENNFRALHLTFAALVSKIIATTCMYPHEVIRTRLRQDVVDSSGRLKYRNFFQSLLTVAVEEGRVGLYGGFGTSLIRQLPNTVVTFLTYEGIIHLLENR